MKKLINLLAIATIAITTCHSQIIEKTSTIEGQSLLWKISGNGLEKPSYLFGTMHLVPKEDFFLPSGTEKTLESANALVMEIDIDIPLKDQIALAQKMLIPNGQTMANFMSEKEYATLISYMIDSLGISEKKTERYMMFKPFFLTGVLMTEALGKVETYEKYFAAKAKKQEKTFIPLETLEFQITLFDTISIEQQIEASISTTMMTEYFSMLDCYLNQDLDCLHKMVTEYDDIEFEKLFLSQRNHNWVEKLENEILPQESAFIAVGAGHLPGKEGLIELLQKRGFTVTPL